LTTNCEKPVELGDSVRNWWYHRSRRLGQKQHN